MAFLRSFGKGEDAHNCAAYLGSCGIEATVIDDSAFGGNMLGLASPGSIRVEVPDEQRVEALELLAALPPVPAPPRPADPIPRPVDDAGLVRLLRTLLVSEALLILAFTIYNDFFYPPPPAAVDEFERSLAFSDWFWALSQVSYWPLTVSCLVANSLCWFFSRFGRALFVATIIWGLISQLGPPPTFLTPWAGFLGTIQGGAGWIAFALMYWSPLRARFEATESVT